MLATALLLPAQNTHIVKRKRSVESVRSRTKQQGLSAVLTPRAWRPVRLAVRSDSTRIDGLPATKTNLSDRLRAS